MNITRLNKELEKEGYYVCPIITWNNALERIDWLEQRVKEKSKQRDLWEKKYKELKDLIPNKLLKELKDGKR